MRVKFRTFTGVFQALRASFPYQVYLGGVVAGSLSRCLK
jgi:hypothetical protein